MKLSKLISELKRQHVFKATIAHLAVACFIIQIASIVFPTFDSSEYVLEAWIYDLTPEELIIELSKTDQLTLISQTPTQILATGFNTTKFSYFKCDQRDSLYQL